MLHCPSLQVTFMYSFNTPISYCTCHRMHKAVLPRHRRREQQRVSNLVVEGTLKRYFTQKKRLKEWIEVWQLNKLQHNIRDFER